MKAVDVENLRFEFGDSWTVVEKWDDSRIFLDGIARLNGDLLDERTGQVASVGSKAVDLVAVREDRLYLIEVKDFRGHPIETKQRQLLALPLAIACKVRDTIAGLVGASRLADEPWVGTCARLLLEPKRSVYVVAWIMDAAPRVAEPLRKREIWQKERSDRLKQRLSWLTPHVAVASPFGGPVKDVVAQNLPGAGQR